MNAINIPLTHQWMMIIDEGHFNMVQLIKDFIYENNLSNLLILQHQLKNIIDNVVVQLNIMEYNSNFKKITYILTSFCDNLFILHGPSEYHNLWNQNSMEKNYFNTVTSGYIFYQDIIHFIGNEQSINGNENIVNNGLIPDFIIYSYWLFFESLNNNNEFYNEKIKNFFLDNIKKNISTKKNITNETFINKNYNQVKINFFNYLIFLMGLILILMVNKKLFWYFINQNIPSVI